MGSTRLPNKHLIDVGGRHILEYLIDRIKAEFKKEIDDGTVMVSIATGNKARNSGFEKEFGSVKVFYGDDENVPKRLLEAAEHFGTDNIVSVDGDDILCSVKAMRDIMNGLMSHTLVKTDGLPLGMNAWGFSAKLLKDKLESMDYGLLETGWGRLFSQGEYNIVQRRHRTSVELRFTLDYPEDLDFFSKVILHLGPKIVLASDDDIIEAAVSNNYYLVNSKMSEEYWANFRSNMNKEEMQAGHV